jgi:uncharacterized protein
VRLSSLKPLCFTDRLNCSFVDDKIKEILDNIHKRETELPEELMHAFKKAGVALADNANEQLKIRHRYNAARYNPQTLSFTIAPTACCNLSCCYCVQRIDESLVAKAAQTATISKAILENVLLFIKRMADLYHAKTLPLTFYGGEPLLKKDLLFYILENLTQWGKERSITTGVGLYTNCTLFDQSFLDNLKKYTIFYVRTTLDGPEKIHNYYRHYKNGKGTYEDVLTSIGMLLDSHIDVRVQVNIHQQYTHIPELLDDLCERGLTHIVIEPYPLFDPITMIPEAQKHYGILKEDVPTVKSTFAVPFKNIFKARAYAYGAAFKRGFKLPPSALKPWVPCEGAQAYNYLIDPAGDVYPCVGSMLIENLRVGHIHGEGYCEVYPFFYEWMNTGDPTRIKRCQTCHFLPSCGGGCIVGRWLGGLPCFCEYGSFYGEDVMKMCLKQKYPEKLKSLDV